MLREPSRVVLCLFVAALALPLRTIAQTKTEGEDKYRWLEDVNGERSMAWVNAENKRSDVLTGDPVYAGLEADALKLLQSPQRLPIPSLNGGDIYNLWQDAEHVQGILRRTRVDDYLTQAPHWQTLLDYDALSKQDGQKWVAHGRVCLYPGNELCMLGLSSGGEDAITAREFNLRTGKFVQNGFVLPRSKQSLSWLDKDTLLVARDWGPGTMTTSGYPFIVKAWHRGQPLEEAKEIYRGSRTDEGAAAVVLHDGDRNQLTCVLRDRSFFETEVFIWTKERQLKQLALPLKSNLEGLLKGQIIFTVNEDWSLGTNSTVAVPKGSVIALDLAAVQRDSSHLRPTIIFSPTSTEFASNVEVTKNHLILTTLKNVQGRAYSFTPGPTGVWSRKQFEIPENRTARIVSTNWSDDRFFLSLDGFLTPMSLWLGDAETNTLSEAKTLPPQFDSSREMVEQLQAVSKDGTKIPYFVVRRKDLTYNGSNPTLLTAYGGFQISITPAYNPVFGKLWLERGGVYVVANIRGGGEFGPAWHEAGLKTHRQRIYDDFAAVAQDLIKRRITSPRRLGIMGDSNGGLLMGVEMTQHPELWNAVMINIPLLDMLRYEHIAAGASWVAEYGSVSVPEQRAFLASISPYNQLKPDVNYPEPLIFTTTRDDRVGPVHARKFAAKMEEFGKPFFYHEITYGGHGSGSDLKERAQTSALSFTYLTKKLMN